MKLEAVKEGVVSYHAWGERRYSSDVNFIKQGFFQKLSQGDQNKLVEQLKKDDAFVCSQKTMGGGWVVTLAATDKHLGLLKMMFLASILTTSMIAPRIIDVFGFKEPGGIFIFPLMFAFLDAISELYGYKRAKETLYQTAFALLLFAGFLWCSLGLPGIGSLELEASYRLVFAHVPLVMATNALCLVVADSVNVYLFHRIKGFTQSRSLWLRCGISTIIGQIIYTGIWVTLSHWGSGHVLELLLHSYTLKILYAVCLIPITYLIVMIIKQERRFKKEYST